MARKHMNGQAPVADVAHDTQDTLSKVQDDLQHRVGYIAGDLRDRAGSLTETAKKRAEDLRTKTGDLRAKTGPTLYQAKKDLGHTLSQATDQIRHTGDTVAESPIVGKITEPLSRATDRVRETEWQQLPTNFSGSMRENPWPFLIGLVIVMAVLWAIRDLSRTSY
jgi:ElaB/YqjD/DUF883 family membrane-anchored ribosome-binding protein